MGNVLKNNVLVQKSYMYHYLTMAHLTVMTYGTLLTEHHSYYNKYI